LEFVLSARYEDDTPVLARKVLAERAGYEWAGPHNDYTAVGFEWHDNVSKDGPCRFIDFDEIVSKLEVGLDIVVRRFK
jgi:hypothetical protein